MIARSISPLWVRALVVMLTVILCPAFVRAAPSAPDATAVARDTSGAVPTDSVPLQSPRALPPMAALGVGLAATVAPTLLAYALTELRPEDGPSSA